jgi:hypothetical protein
MITMPNFKYSEILWKFGFLPIPGIGIVRSLYTPAYPDWTSSMFHAPALTWSFSSWESEQEEQYFQSQHPVLWSEMVEVSTRWRTDIQKGSDVTIDGVGILKGNGACQPVFFQDNESSLPAYYSILPSLSFSLPDNKSTQVQPELPVAPVKKSKSTFFSRSKVFAVLALLLLFIAVWWLSTPVFVEQEIPNGRVNLKPGDYYGIDSNVVDQNTDNAELPDADANFNVAPNDTVTAMDSYDSRMEPCYVVLGSFLNKNNSLRLKEELIKRGLTVELIPYDSFTRVSVLIECRESEEKLAAFRSTFNPEAWLLD